MRANEFITEQPVTTTNAQGVTTTVNKAANRVTTKDAGGTVVKDRSGGIRSMTTPKIGGFQAKQTFRPDATPGYQQATYQQGPTTLSVKGSPETGFTKSAKFSAGGMDVKQTQRYSGQKQTDASLKMGNSTVYKAKLTQSQFNEFGPAERVVTVGGTTVRANSRTGKVSANTKIGNTNLSVDNTLNKDGSSGKMSAATKIGNTTATYNTNKSGQQSLNVSSNLGNNKTISATSNIAKPGAKPVTKMSLTQSQFEDVQAAIREHVAKRVPFTECMFRPGSAAFTEFYRQVRECADKLNLDWEDQELIATDIGECIMVEGEMVALDVPMIEEEELDERKENPFQMDLTAYDFPVSDETKYDGEGVQSQLLKSISMNGQKDVNFDNGKTVKVPSNIAEIVLSKINQTGTTQNKFKIIKYISQSYENLMNFAKNDISEAEYQGRKVKLNSPKRGGSKKFYVYTKNKKGNVIKVSWGDTTGLSVKAKDRGAVKSFVARHKCKEKNDKTKAGYWACRTPRYKSLGVKGGQWW